MFGAGVLGNLAAELAALGVRRPLVVSDRGLTTAGIAQRVQAACDVGARAVLFDAVTENPLFADADAGAACYRQHGCDAVVAVGGGSVIDTAKVIALLATNAGCTADYVGVPNAAHSAAAPLIAVPTTAGTGSEASPSAGLHPDVTTPSLGMNSRHLVPRMALLDPDLTVSLPPRLTAATGIDALSHCIEGYLSERDQPLGKAMALHGIERVVRHLRQAVEHCDDVTARGQMLLAALAGGISIGMGLGPAHSMALTCSDQGFHHGVLSGIGLVATLDATAAHVPGRMAAVNAAFGLPAAASLAQGIATLMRDLGLPTTLAELGYAAPNVQALADAAARSHFNLSAPYRPSAEDYAKFFRRSLRQEHAST
nr:iron-containing alcohol dehydrogenase [Variovorax dokdonensis]